MNVAGETEVTIDGPVTVDNLHQQLILGCDVLMGAQIDLQRRILTLQGQSWPLRNY